MKRKWGACQFRRVETGNSTTVHTVVYDDASFDQTITVKSQGIDPQMTDDRRGENGVKLSSHSVEIESISGVRHSGVEWGCRYDAMGNREFSREKAQNSQKETICQPNSLNQYTSISTSVDSVPSVVNLQYDLNGNMTNDGVRAYTWDTQNELIRVQDGQPVEGSTRVDFAYDFMGRRISKSVSHFESSIWNLKSQTWFAYDGWNLVREVSTDLTTSTVSTNSYTWGLDLSGTLQGAGGVGGLLSQTISTTSTNSTSLTAYYAYDHNGNVEKVLTRSGAVVAAFQYDAFGNTISESVASGLQSEAFPIRFSTKYWDSETGLYYYGYRYYSPEKGRWINRDPVGERTGGNRYDFCRNNTVRNVDVMGLYAFDMHMYAVYATCLRGN
jgi:RHS repeat-associated protein